MATQAYKARGGGYAGPKQEDTHLHQWTEEDWGTKSGRKSAETGERYLPKAARESLAEEEYARTSRKKRADAAKGKQFSSQPKDVARKTAKRRQTGKSSGGSEPTKAELYEKAKQREVPGRSRMSKRELMQAVT